MDNIEQRIDSIFSQWQQGICPGGQVAVRKNGELIYNKNFGYANIEHRIPVTDDTVFHVASVSKQVTVMCILLLQEDGKLSIDDDIRKYIADLINFKEPVTIRQMMNNVSGIRDQWELLSLRGVRIVDTISQWDALSLISRQENLNFQPQSQFLYSNSNFTLLAEIVERLSGKTLNDFATERIFKPLGMESTFYKDNYWKLIENKASSYYDDGTGQYVYSVLNYGTYGATSLNTTATDFLKWMDNYRYPTICSQNTLNVMWEAPKLTDGTDSSYAGGLFVGEYKGHKYIEHGGADASFRSAMLRFTEEDIDIMLLSNTQNLLMKDAAFSVAAAVFGYEEVQQNEDQPKEYSEEYVIDDLEGYYYNSTESTFMTLDITLINGHPHLKNVYGYAPLTHVSGNHFKYEQMNLDLYLGSNSVLKSKDKVLPLKKLKPFKALDSSTYVGRYASRELDTNYNIIEKDGYLHLSHFRHGEQVIYQVDEQKFITHAPFAFELEFMKKDNQMMGFTLTGNRAKNVLLVKESD